MFVALTRRQRLATLAFMVAALPGAALAQETVTYTYDELGRLKTVTRTGGPTNGAATTYTYDKASNRTNVTTTGGQNGDNGGSGATANTLGYVTVPILGGALIYSKN